MHLYHFRAVKHQRRDDSPNPPPIEQYSLKLDGHAFFRDEWAAEKAIY